MDQNIEHIIGLVLTGQAGQHEKSLLDNWLAQSSENQETFNKLKMAWNTRPSDGLYPNEHEVAEGVWQRLHHGQANRLKSSSYGTLYKVAAAVLILLTFSALLYQESKNSPVAQEKAVANMITKSNPTGVKSTIILPDGSTVVLNAESKISYQAGFNDSLRMVALVGEAYFQVAKDLDRPFVVQSGNVRTKALGTEFNVNAYEDENKIDVALSTGKVLVYINGPGPAKDYYLNPGERLRVTRENNQVKKGTFDRNEVLAWKDGVIYFNQAGLKDVTATLGRWYGVQFEIHNWDGKPWHYTGEFKNEYLDIILKSMSYSKHFKYNITKDKVILDLKNN